MQDKTYDTGDDPSPRMTCAKEHYSHCQDKGHIDSCYKLDRTAPAARGVSSVRRSERKSLGCFGTHRRGQTDKSVSVSPSLVINTLNHGVKRTSRCGDRHRMAPRGEKRGRKKNPARAVIKKKRGTNRGEEECSRRWCS